MSGKTGLSMIAFALLFTATGYEAAEALNPQPLPPRKFPVYTATGIHTTTTHNVYLPPGPCRGSQLAVRKGGKLVPAGTQGAHCLNPQPLPPG